MSKAARTLPLMPIMRKAGALAHAGARRFGGRAASYIAEVMRQAWAEARLAGPEVVAMRARAPACSPRPT